MAKSRRKRKAPGKELATRSYVKQAVSRGLSYDTKAFYWDQQSATVGAGVTHVDITAQVHASETIVGDSIENLQLLIRGEVGYQDATNYTRLLVYKWRPDTGDTTPGVNDIIRNDQTQMAPFGFPHWEKRGTYKILFDKVYYCDNAGPQRQMVNIALGKKKLGRSLFNAGSATGTDHIYFAYVSDSTLSGPTLNWNVRMLYRADTA